MRLVTSTSPDGKTLEAGLQIKLDKGWKTYWKAPGASGIPPQVSFFGSKNVNDAKLDFPVPSVFPDGEGLSAGYKDEVTFPINLTRLSKTTPTLLKASGLVGICSDICVPVQFSLSVEDDNKAGSNFDVISALSKAKSNLVAPSSNVQGISAVKYVAGSPATLSFEARVPEGAKAAELHVEGPYNWYLSPVRATEISGKIARFDLPLYSLPKDAKPTETKLKVSLVVDGRGTEQEITPSR